MKTNKISATLAAGTLLTTLLACNLGAGAAPTVVSPSPNTTAPAEAPTNAPEANSGGACDNPFLPVKVGATWSYKISGEVSESFTRSELSVEAGGFSDQDQYASGLTRQSQWNCENGNLIALNLGQGTSSTVTFENLAVNFQTTELSGVTIPAAINAGDIWSQSITLEGTEKINDLDVPAKNHTQSDCTAVGNESVTVEAGTFDAMRFDCKTEINVAITMQGSEIPYTISMNSSNWYAPNIGMIKTTSSGSDFNSVIELTAYAIP
ncbi:MAG: hypothetical protein LC108_03490 [Anaerolineales bacterium]|nr:hypothetical protein [Anaerolineales bacterium]